MEFDAGPWALIVALAAAGVFAGFIGGLFGVGGGIVLVPALFHLFGAFGAGGDVRAHAAVATSLSTIVVTSWRSLEAHRKAGAVDFSLLRQWTPWVALGAALGGALASLVETQMLLLVFGAGLFLIAANMMFGRDHWRLARDMPTGMPRAGLGSAIGALSAMMGIGGGAFGVTMMTLCGRTIHQAVATASGFGAAIALPAILVNMATGWGKAGLPWGSIGYVNLPGFILLALLTAFSAPFGARMAHRLDRVILKRAFSLFLLLTASNILWEAWRA